MGLATIDQDSSEITDKDWIGWGVTLLSVGIAAIGLYFTARSLKYTANSFLAESDAKKEESNARYIQSLSSIESEFTKIESLPERGATDTAERLRWETTFLNAVQRLAWLTLSGKYPEEFSDYYKLVFQWARDIIEKTGNGQIKELRKKHYNEILVVCEKKGWEPVDVENLGST